MKGSGDHGEVTTWLLLKSFKDKIAIIVAAPLRPDRDKLASSMGVIKCP